MGEDILSVIFLALICIVVAGIVRHIAPDTMIMPTYALLAVCLWIAYDYILLKRHKQQHACEKPADINRQTEDRIRQLVDDINSRVPDAQPEPVEQTKEDRPAAKHKAEFDIKMYDGQSPIQEIHSSMGSSGDTQLANRMKYMSLQPRMSQEIRARHNANTLKSYFEEELQEQENRDWWDVEADYLDEFM